MPCAAIESAACEQAVQFTAAREDAERVQVLLHEAIEKVIGSFGSINEQIQQQQQVALRIANMDVGAVGSTGPTKSPCRAKSPVSWTALPGKT